MDFVTKSREIGGEIDGATMIFCMLQGYKGSTGYKRHVFFALPPL